MTDKEIKRLANALAEKVYCDNPVNIDPASEAIYDELTELLKTHDIIPKSPEAETPKQTVYVVVESSWDGYSYSADDATVFTTKEEAEKYKEWLNERFKANTSTIIVETEIETKFEEP